MTRDDDAALREKASKLLAERLRRDYADAIKSDHPRCPHCGCNVSDDALLANKVKLIREQNLKAKR